MQLTAPGEYRNATEIKIMQENLPFDDANVLELGCGTAYWTRTIAEHFPLKSMIATEVDKVQHQKNLRINDLPKVEFRMGGAESINLPDASMDIVIMLKSLHHVPMQSMQQALREIHRILRPGGLAYISEPVYAGDFNQILRMFNDEKKVREAAFDALKNAVSRGGFSSYREIFFQSENHFSDFSEFERRILFPSHSDHGVDEPLHQQVKNAFMAHMTENGAHFVNPNRVDILQRQ